MARDIMSVLYLQFLLSLVSAKLPGYSKTGRRRLLPEHVEMLTCMKDWDQAVRKEQHAPQDIDLEELFDNL
jgi:hypothetical protein